MSDRPTPADLADAGRFRPIFSFGHDQIAEAARDWMARRSPLTVAYLLANAAVAAGFTGTWVRTGATFDRSISGAGLGFFLGFLILLPLHEWVHALAYRAVGATSTRVVYRLKQLTAYCVADGFVADGRAFAIVCLAPFVVINSLLLAALVAVGGFAPALWGALLLHVAACTGDVAFANIVWHHRGRRLYTYDDPDGQSHFFVERAAEPADA